MEIDSSPDNLELTPEEQREWAGLLFFDDELEKLKTRGLIPEASLLTIASETEERQRKLFRIGTARTALRNAGQLRAKEPAEALKALEYARAVAPDFPEPWMLAIAIEREVGNEDAAITLCEEANQRVANFPLSIDSLKEELEAAKKAREAAAQDPLVLARDAIKAERDQEAIALCTMKLNQDPNHFDALVLRAFARQRSELLAAALEDYRLLVRLKPSDPTWAKWVESVRARQAAAGKPSITRVPALTPSVEVVARSVPSIPRGTWSNLANQFMLAHWQKLILCLAVLLIVVSSNMGAYQLLGPRLWSPIGKCILALVYTGMFTGFGAGLTRWGAQRAGRIMLVTTLVMIPANFMLVGEMRLLTEPSASRLLVFALDAVALFLLIQLVVWSLDWKHGGKLLGLFFFVACVFNAGSSPGVAWPLGLQVSLFLAPAVFFLCAVAWIVTSFQEKQVEDRAEITYFALAIFTFAFATGLVRTGVFTLHLEPTFYAVPLMLTAIATLFTTSKLARFDPNARHEAWMRYVGLVLSGLGIALALARPPSPSAIYSGNTFAAAILGLGLYSAGLRKTRAPAYLYFAFGALFLAYFGAFYFVVDLVRSVEEVARQALGYQHKLPPPFKAINGLVFNTALGGLCLFFQRVWNDPRLARHCHYIGVPFSIAACVFSGLEPTAGLICLSGYSILYTIAIRLFTEPRAVYLATLAFSGAAYFAALVIGGATPAQEILLGSALALGYSLLGSFLERRAAGSALGKPLRNVALGLASLMILAALISIPLMDAVSWEAAVALGLVALVYVLANREFKTESLAYAAGITGSLAYALLVHHFLNDRANGFGLAPYCLAAGAAALVLSAIGDWSRGALRSGADLPRLAPYPRPLLNLAMVQSLLAIITCVIHADQRGTRLTTADFAIFAFGLIFTCRALMILTHAAPLKSIAAMAIVCGLGFWVSAFQALNRGAIASFAGYGLVVSTYALVMLGLEEAAKAVNRKKKGFDPDFATTWFPSADLFARVIPALEVVVAALACGLAVYGLEDRLSLSLTFALSALAMFWSTRFRLHPRIVDLGLAYAVAAVLCLTLWRLQPLGFGLALSWLVLAASICGLLLGGFGRFTESKTWGRVYAPCSFRAASILGWGVLPFAVLASAFGPNSYRAATAALLVNAVSLIGLTWFRGRAAFCYRALFSFTLAVYVVIFSVGKSDPNSFYILGLVGVLIALLFSTAGFVASWKRDASWVQLIAKPLFNSALVLTVGATFPAFRAPWTNALIALSFLLFVKAIPSRYWLYPAIAFLANGIYWGVVVDFSETRYVIAAMVAAYQLWLLGLLVRRLEPSLRRWLSLSDGKHDEPIFNAAIAFAVLAAAIRVNETFNGAMKWTDSAGLALNLAVFCLFVVKAYPSSGWLHGAVVLASLSVVMVAAPEPTSVYPLLPIGMALSIGWFWVGKGLARVDESVRQRLGIEDVGSPGVANLWSQAFFAITAPFIAIVVASALALSIWNPTAVGITYGPWIRMLIAIGLGVFSVVCLFWGKSLLRLLAGLWAFALAGCWWLVIEHSHLLVQLGLSSRDVAPIVTANFAFATLLLSLIWKSPRPALQWLIKRHYTTEDETARIESLSASAGTELAWLAIVMTFGVMGPSASITYLVVATGFSVVAVAASRVKSAAWAGVAWAMLATHLSVDIVLKFGIDNKAETETKRAKQF